MQSSSGFYCIQIRHSLQLFMNEYLNKWYCVMRHVTKWPYSYCNYFKFYTINYSLHSFKTNNHKLTWNTTLFIIIVRSTSHFIFLHNLHSISDACLSILENNQFSSVMLICWMREFLFLHEVCVWLIYIWRRLFSCTWSLE